MTVIFGLLAALSLVGGLVLLAQIIQKPNTESETDSWKRQRIQRVRTFRISTAITFLVMTPFMMLIAYVTGLEVVTANEEGVVVDSPIFWGEGAVQKDARYTGRHFVWPTSQMFRYLNIPTTVEEPFTDLPSSDNVQMDFRIYTVLQLIPGQAPAVHDSVGFDWYANRIQKPYRTFIRDKMMQLTSDEQRLDSTKLRATEIEIQKTLEKLLDNAGIRYNVFSVSIGGVTPPDGVLAESERTASQTQREKTEVRRTEAEIQREKAERKRALADKAYMDEIGMSPDQFITLEGYNAFRDAAARCAESKQTCTLIVGQPSANIAVPAGTKAH